jgi:ribulose-phosphate 3-epimerase
MGVNPGQAGQIYLPYAENKIDQLLELKKEYNFSIGLDGACNVDRIKRLYEKGVDNFVLGTAALFYGDMDYISHVNVIKEAVGGFE